MLDFQHSLITERRGDKYSADGWYKATHFDHLNISDKLKQELAEITNHALAKKTWSAYSSALNRLEDYSSETGNLTRFPMEENDVISFVAWLLEEGLTASTINTYMSGLRQLHLALGFSAVNLRSQLINTIIKGKQNQDNLRKKGLATRLPMTVSLMKLLKHEIKKMEISNVTKIIKMNTE